ncbi:MAG TPA: hypothetical protein VLA56_11395 [Pseudomonadales bacterium]|nr:hypothetical protein [Pseudomonadales bacterium]
MAAPESGRPQSGPPQSGPELPPPAPLPLRAVGGLIVAANVAGIFYLLLNTAALATEYERLMLPVLVLLEAMGILSVWGGVLLMQGRRLGFWVLLLGHGAQTLLDLGVGFPPQHSFLPLALLALVTVVLVPLRDRLR